MSTEASDERVWDGPAEEDLAALGRGETVASVARRFEVDPKTVRSYRRRAAQGTLRPRPAGRRGPVKLTAADL